MKQFKMNEKQRFSIRKFSIGAASVLLGSAFLAISPISVVQANEDNATLSSETLNKTKLKDLIDEIDKKFAKGTYANKTDESVNALKTVLEEARTTLANATTQDQFTTAYRALLTATTQLQSKPKTGNPTPKPGGDTTKGKPTVGKKAENTEPKAGTNSIENTGSHDPRNGQAMDTDNPFRTGEQPASEPIADESYNSFVFSENDKDFKNHSKLEWFSKEGDGSNRNNASLKYGEDEDGKYMEWKSSQSRGGGFKLTIDKELGEEYTIGVKFSFDQTNGSWKKIIDYKNSESDNGFYFYSGGHLQFYPNGTISKNAVSNKEVVNFIIVKSKTEFAVYFVKKDGNITKEFSLTDTTTLSNAIPYTNNGKTILGFFFDDMRTGSEATPGGKIYSLSIYDKAIEPSKVVEKLNKKLDSDTHQPELKSPLPDVEKGSNPNAEDFIKNTPTSNDPNKLPANTRITWKTELDTSSAGSKPAKILVTYPDGSTDEVDVNVNVVNRDFTPAKPAKTPVGDVNKLTTDEVNKIKKAVEDVNAGKTVSVDETGKATVTDPTTNISHEIPASDLKVQDFTPAKPAKTPVGDINNLTTDEVNKIKKAVEDANPGKTVTVDATGKATVTDSSTNISHDIPADKLVVKMHISIAPVTPQFKKPTNNTDSKPDAVIPVEDLIRKSEQPSQTVEATNQSGQQIEPSKDKQQSFQNILPNTGTSDKVGLLSVIGVTLLVTSLGTMIPMKKRDE